MGKQGVIYKIENVVNGKVYIGQTRISFSKRRNSHLHALRSNSHRNNYLQNAWNKYGEKNFKFELVKYCEVDELNELEAQYISSYESLAHQKGYNIESGGNVNKIVHPSTRAKMSKRMKKWIVETGHIQRLAEMNKGDNSSSARKIVLVNTGEVFGSIVSAHEKYPQASQACIGLCCARKIKQAGQMEDGTWMIWEYEENFDKQKEYEFRKKKVKTHSRPVICINTNEVFDSLEEACSKYGINKPTLVKACKGIHLTCGKLTSGERLQWAYYEEGKVYQLKDYGYIDELLKPKRVKLINTNEIFATVGEASRKYGLSVTQISNCCKKKSKSAGKDKNGNKLIWEYVI